MQYFPAEPDLYFKSRFPGKAPVNKEAMLKPGKALNVRALGIQSITGTQVRVIITFKLVG
jgi:hypothetical protein